MDGIVQSLKWDWVGIVKHIDSALKGLHRLGIVALIIKTKKEDTFNVSNKTQETQKRALSKLRKDSRKSIHCSFLQGMRDCRQAFKTIVMSG